ncbi:MAG TPA: hypothetical protein VF194_01040 [Ferrovibrio sp.]|uniref:hypothetical protein n=1 Tax=Ferrovibrio sp. TaxID=1917215 RepID=UPI002ED55BF3
MEASGVKQKLYFVGLRVAQDSQLAVLTAVTAGLENIKQITKAAAPMQAGVGGQVDISV